MLYTIKEFFSNSKLLGEGWGIGFGVSKPEERRLRITEPYLSLRWLPVMYRIDFRILLFTFKALHALPPIFIKDLLTPNEPS